MGLLGSRPSLEESLADANRSIQKAIRDIDRDQRGYEQEQNRLEKEIERYVRTGKSASARQMARDLVRLRKSMEKNIAIRGEYYAILLRLQSTKSFNSLAAQIDKLSNAMLCTNKSLDQNQVQSMVSRLTNESSRVFDSDVILTSGVSRVFQQEIADAEEEEKILSSALEEFGLGLNESSIGSPSIPVTNPCQLSGFLPSVASVPPELNPHFHRQIPVIVSASPVRGEREERPFLSPISSDLENNSRTAIFSPPKNKLPQSGRISSSLRWSSGHQNSGAYHETGGEEIISTEKTRVDENVNENNNEEILEKEKNVMDRIAKLSVT